MYFGDARRRNKSLVEFREKVIEQVIVALLVLQQKGNLLLKVDGTLDCFTASLIMVLFDLFGEIGITKPYLTDFGS